MTAFNDISVVVVEGSGDSIAPSVSFVAPDVGLYVFGNRLLSMNRLIVVGALGFEVVASDNVGVDLVEFFVDNILMFSDDEIWS